jgi:hypothetical protein
VTGRGLRSEDGSELVGAGVNGVASGYSEEGC